ncbi:Protein of uncharacterised function (DUF3243) [Chlamydia abortus]|uniref:DUF3243 domain-containing protein n=1 Tax=Paenibacillus residui TaxID=629724 RepID=A0ABW3DA22_9BACL|nr:MULTISPECIES: DUF3243 domain-containing protein [Paenibacillaceae]SHE12079.1 Protein of uncharacterised function (DUF3243) [Chlamydia abortus]
METTVLKSIEKWKEFLSNRVSEAEKAGMSEETISKLAYQIGGFLADKIDPKNNEERMLKELWDVADTNEQQMIAKLMIKWVKES